LGVSEECEWVFSGEAQGKPLQDIKRIWEDVRAKAELPAVCIHDLRHTFASLLVSGGMTLQMIGKLLGHIRSKPNSATPTCSMIHCGSGLNRSAICCGRSRPQSLTPDC
jgi:Phage integrase family